MKRLGWVAFVVGSGGLLAGAACTNRTPQTTSAGAAPEAATSTIQAGSTLVDCGPGQRVLLQQANGVTQVQCVPAATIAGGTLAYGGSSDFLQPTPVQANVPAPVVYDAPVQARPAYYEPRPEPRPVVRRVATRDGRTWKKSAVIIGGSTAAGAGVGALMGGRDGAKKGAVAGLLGGVVYDIATRNK